MKSSASGWFQVEISLDDSEISRLEKETLHGKITWSDTFEHERKFNNCVELCIGELKKNLYVEMESYPKKRELVNRNYRFTISKEAYDSLKTNGATGDRINSTIKVSIAHKDWFDLGNRYKRFPNSKIL
jgi:hypothetical protein